MNNELDNKPNIVKLAGRIADLLEKGVLLTEKNLDFISSYFSISTGSELENQLKDENFEIDTLLELVLSPDEAFQGGLEQILETGLFSKSDEEKILEKVMSLVSETKIIFPENRGSVSVPVPRDIMSRFVSKLKVQNNIPDKLLKIINRYLDDQLKKITKVKLRHSNLNFDSKVIDFLSSLIEKTCFSVNDYIDYLEFSISVLENTKSGKSVITLFQEKKIFYTTAKNKIMQVEEQLKTGTMETIMLQGISVPSLSSEDIRKKIALIDRVLFIIFGFAEHGENKLDVDLGDYSGDQDIQKIFRLLS